MRRWQCWSACVAVLFAMSWIAASLHSQEKKAPVDRAALREFMRKKLGASSQILEGLCTEDARLVTQGAQALTEMSAAEKWRVSNDPIYRQFSEEFGRVTKKLAAAAEKGNFDDVQLKWIDTTMSCVECHKWVRGIRITTN